MSVLDLPQRRRPVLVRPDRAAVVATNKAIRDDALRGKVPDRPAAAAAVPLVVPAHLRPDLLIEVGHHLRLGDVRRDVLDA